ncbi:hypothetical protein DL762_000539 [Monosporascus cannonballus]|uniref:Prolyl 4-hydroxylase alpha subunit Fe(2+) 2OG dioxygenase domain-containing protein n=1 Tax=Monosporascus cannonballus TaxID=155416 RepID=A0ABY0HLZ3_9PEZI|nr:hypothetical protein DL762_000539 [Monosporascus cannonballus]
MFVNQERPETSPRAKDTRPSLTRGLEVAGIPIPLPLTAHDAQAIRAACRRAPYGKGEATLVDESVRKTWELGRDEFRLANQPDWDAFVVNALLRDLAVRALEMPSSGVRAEPYKLLLYEEGSFFRRHKDSEKAPGMVGTLVVCLPARHDGGDVRLSHAGKSRMFATSRTSAYGLTALAWFSDVTHEITQETQAAEFEGEYTGNEGMPNTLRYHDTAAMIVSREYHYGILDEEDGDGHAIYWSLSRDYKVELSPKPDWDALLGGYGSSVRGLSEFSSVYRKVDSLLGHDDLRESLRGCWSSVEERKFESEESLDLEDPDFVMELITAHSADSGWVQSSLIPKLSDRGTKPLLYALVERLANANRDGALEHAVAITKDLVESAQSKLTLETADFFVPKWDRNRNFTGRQSTDFARCIEHCLQLGLGPQAERLLGASSQDPSLNEGRPSSHPVDVGAVEELLGALASSLPRYGVPPFGCVGDLFATLLRTYVYADAPTPPRRLPGWAHRPRGCGCEDCRDLDRFLGAADENVGRFSVNKEKRQHIEYRLPRYYDKSREIFSCSLDQERKPCTLVVTKVRQGREFEEDAREYRERLERFEQCVRPLRLEYVEQSMGWAPLPRAGDAREPAGLGGRDAARRAR